MFTGIITHIGKISKLEINQDKDLFIVVSTNHIAERKLEIGCSIACNGVCLTLVEKNQIGGDYALSFQASYETVTKTNFKDLRIGDLLNLEFAMRLGDEFGGHMVSGHVDGCAVITEITPIQESHLFRFEAPKNLVKYIAKKGSVTLNGVSLTVNEIDDAIFDINLISHTIDNTIFKNAKIGDLVNLEVDLLARYLDKLQK